MAYARCTTETYALKFTTAGNSSHRPFAARLRPFRGVPDG
jgi:hypothetical protein